MNATADIDISEDMANVVPIKQFGHEEKLQRLADLHRSKENAARQQIADIRKGQKAYLAQSVLNRKAARARFDAEILAIDEADATAKANSESLIAGEKKMAAYNQSAARAALEALAE